MPTLTRQELYDLVWSTPMTKLAQGFGISDVGLAKICDRHRVPTPPRGYWAKKEAGKKVKQTIFVQVDDPLLDRVSIDAARDRIPEPVREIIEQRRAERKAARSTRPAPAMAPPHTELVANPHPAIRATAAALRSARPSKRGVVEAIGPGLCGMSIGIHSVERIISFLERLARACEARGMSLVPHERHLAAAIGPDEAMFEITEKTKQVPHILSAAEIAIEEKRRKRNERIARGSWDDAYVFDPSPPTFDILRSGQLGLHIFGWGDGVRRSWNDGKTQALETLLDGIVDGLEGRIVTKRLEREKLERAEAEQQELERRRGLAKARRERENQRKRLLNRLIQTRRRVAQLREWIRSYEMVADIDSQLARMIEWAREQLSGLEMSLEPGTLVKELNTRRLFPETDDLVDPLGEPPLERYWY